MDAKLTPALAHRLAAYSATAGVALAIAQEADGQVVYHDFDPNLTVHAANPPLVVPLDLDDDGTLDINLIGCNSEGYVGCVDGRARRVARPRAGQYYPHYRVALGAAAGNGILGYDHFYVGNCASRLGIGEVVGPAGPGQGFYRYAVAASASYSYGPYCPFAGEEGYAGFLFVAGDGQRHYGWLRLSAADNAINGFAYEVAYESGPNTPILAGARSAALLDGAVNQTSFPPEGGLLVYTYTVENTTDEPLHLHLWVQAEHEGGGTFTRKLGAGTLAPGATVTRTAEVRMTPGTSSGTYEVDFKLGDFASGQFITFERFAITKEATGGVAEGGGEPFEVSPYEGDLFSAAEASAFGGVGTHVLSEAIPNPSDGRAALTLSVAEVQVVRVEVLDALGRQVALLHDGPLSAGTEHRLTFDGSDLPVGVYVVRAVGETFSDVRVLTLTR
jgi:hypothetical protein